MTTESTTGPLEYELIPMTDGTGEWAAQFRFGSQGIADFAAQQIAHALTYRVSSEKAADIVRQLVEALERYDDANPKQRPKCPVCDHSGSHHPMLFDAGHWREHGQSAGNAITAAALTAARAWLESEAR